VDQQQFQTGVCFHFLFWEVAKGNFIDDALGKRTSHKMEKLNLGNAFYAISHDAEVF